MSSPFTQLNQPNAPGIHTFLYVPTTDISQWPGIVAKEVDESAIVLNGGKSWTTGLSVFEQMKFDEQPQETEHGMLYNKELQGFLPQDSEAVTQALETMLFVPFVIKLKDRQGQHRIVGTPDEPVYFSFEFTTGAVGGSRGYNFSFRGKHRSKSPFLV